MTDQAFFPGAIFSHDSFVTPEEFSQTTTLNLTTRHNLPRTPLVRIRATTMPAKSASKQAHTGKSEGNQSGGGGAKSTPMTTQAAAKIQSNQAKASGGGVAAGSFAARAQAAAARNKK